MFCQICGTQLRPSARFCRNCGEKVETYDDDNSRSQLAPPQAEEELFYPWWQNVNSIILPISPELLEEDANKVEPDSRTQVIPIMNSPVPTLIDSPTPVERPNRTATAREKPVTGISKQSPAPKPRSNAKSKIDALPLRAPSVVVVEPERQYRRKRSPLGVPLLMLAVILVFVLAFFWLK